MPQRQISSSPPGSPTGPTALATASPGQRPGQNQPSSNPPPAAPRPFASTLVLPPSENPTAHDPTPDAVLASAARLWDEQVRAHAVPGFAVVRPGSEPPPTAAPSTPPLPAPGQATRGSRAPNAMKVTQPLGSFLPQLLQNDPAAAAGLEPYLPPRSPVPPRSPIPARPPSVAPNEELRYSYVSAAPAENTVTTVRPSASDWKPDATLVPALRRALCEQLYPLAVERCLVVLVVGVPECAEQKSRVAAELALALAESVHPRILLIEADLQTPRVHRLMRVDMPMSSGFSQQLRSVPSNTQRRWTVVSCGKSLHVLAEGVMRSPGLLLSQRFSQGLSELRNYYDIIVIDGPTESLSLEAQALDAVADGIVFVCGADGSASLAGLQAEFTDKFLKIVVPSA